MKRLIWGRFALIISIFILSTNNASALIGASTNYALGSASMPNLVNSSSSVTYTGTHTVGDNLEGVSSSTSYELCAGFVEEALGGCVTAAPPPPPPPPPGGGGTGGRPPGYVWPSVTQETENIPPETQETTETEETIETQPTEEIPVAPEIRETQETQSQEAGPGVRPAAPTVAPEEDLHCTTAQCFSRGGYPLHGAAIEKEIPWCFILANMANALITSYFIWEMVILYLMPDNQKKKKQSKGKKSKKSRR